MLKKKTTITFLSLLLLVVMSATCVSVAESAEEYADPNAFLEDMAAGIKSRLTYADADTSTMSTSDLLDYYNKLVSYELESIGKYDNLKFSDEKFDALAHSYIDACEMQMLATENKKDLALYEALWNGARTCRAGLIITLYERYDLPISEEDAEGYRPTVTYTVVETEPTYEETVITPVETETPERNVHITASSYEVSDGYYLPVFTVQNDSDRPFSNISIWYTVQDEQGNVLNSELASIQATVNPGKTVNLTGYIEADDIQLPVTLVPDYADYTFLGDDTSNYNIEYFDSENAKEYSIIITEGGEYAQSTTQDSIDIGSITGPSTEPTSEPTPSPTTVPTADPMPDATNAVPGIAESEKTAVQVAYESAVSIEFDDLDRDSIGAYSYKGINIPQDQVKDFMGKKIINQDAIYISIARQLEGFYVFGEKDESTGTRVLYPNWGKNVVPLVFGFEKRSYEAMLPYVSDASMFINRSYPIGEMLSRLQHLSVCKGTFDYKNGVFDFTISDLPKAAKELKITEQMLGYIFAWLDIYGQELVFSGTSCSSELRYSAVRTLDKDDFKYRQGYNMFGDNEEDFIEMSDGNSGYCHFYCQTQKPSYIDDFTYNFSTHKGIQLLHSKDAVILSYGPAETRPYDPKTDVFDEFELGETDIQSILSESCSNYIVYTYEDDASYQIAFYFDYDDRVICVAYFKGEQPWLDPYVVVGTQYTEKAIVQMVQEELNKRGYDCGAVDGVIGSRTRDALKAYQGYAHLIVNGAITDELLASLGISGSAVE